MYSRNISKTNAISMQNTIHSKTEKKSMQSERREKIDNLRVPQPIQEICAPSTNTRTTTLSRGQNIQKGNE